MIIQGQVHRCVGVKHIVFVRPRCVAPMRCRTHLLVAQTRRQSITRANFHHVNLANCGPRATDSSQSPESGPKTFCDTWQFNTGFNCAVFKVYAPFGFQTTRGKLSAAKGFPTGFDNEFTVFDTGVFGSAGVIFQFRIAPTAQVALATVAKIVRPRCGIDRRRVEVFFPNKGLGVCFCSKIQ